MERAVGQEEEDGKNDEIKREGERAQSLKKKGQGTPRGYKYIIDKEQKDN